MNRRMGFILLILCFVEAFAAIHANNLDARPFRRFFQRPYSTTNPQNAQAGVVQRTAEKPVIPELKEEIQKPAAQQPQIEKANLATAVQPKAEPKRYTVLTEPVITRGFSPYELLGMDFSATIAKFPEKERKAMEQILEWSSVDYLSIMTEKYPNVRPEVTEALVKIAEGVQNKASRQELGKIVDSIPFSPRQLTSAEVLAINQELAPAVDEEEFRAIHGLNQFRMRSGLRPLLIDLLLVLVSRGHSSDMQRFGFFSHNSPVSGKSTFSSRARLLGASASAENIYMGSYSGNAANNAWINSSGHRANMLGGYSRVGVGRIGGFFTQMFGR
ncbi:MAG: hypothetical protein K6C40_12535 [Thermoguttaceae bacterium]|nr:hypothetical protein [Thermoguttaceae bacterium]